MKKTLILFAACALFMGVGIVQAEDSSDTQRTRGELRRTIQEKAKKMIEEQKSSSASSGIVKELQKQLKNERKNIIDQLKEKIKSTITRRFNGTLKFYSGNSLTVTTSTGDITVLISGNTILKRKFGADAKLEEFLAGDNLAIVGSRRNDANGEVEARYIRNLSIQRRNTVFTGIITGKGNDEIIVQTQSRGEQTAYIGDETKITEKGRSISADDLETGSRVIIKGQLWDRANSKIDATSVMKLPQKTSD